MTFIYNIATCTNLKHAPACLLGNLKYNTKEGIDWLERFWPVLVTLLCEEQRNTAATV
jgi:hypothetical protein